MISQFTASLVALFLVAGSVHAQRSVQRIEQASFITIGGIEQWSPCAATMAAIQYCCSCTAGRRTSSRRLWLANLLKLLEASGETEASIKAIGDGMNASGAALVEDMINEDLSSTALTFRIPYYVIQGRHDLFTPTPLAEAYFNKISAPEKRLIIIEDAGHFALATHQADVIAALKAAIQ